MDQIECFNSTFQEHKPKMGTEVQGTIVHLYLSKFYKIAPRLKYSQTIAKLSAYICAPIMPIEELLRAAQTC